MKKGLIGLTSIVLGAAVSLSTISCIKNKETEKKAEKSSSIYEFYGASKETIEKINQNNISNKVTEEPPKKSKERTNQKTYDLIDVLEKEEPLQYIPINRAEKNIQDSTCFYVIKKRETLSEIATKYSTTAEELARINSIKDKNLIYEGREIITHENCED